VSVAAPVSAPAPAPVGAEAPVGRPVRWLARLLLAGWVVTLVWLSLVALRPATLADLEADLRAGEVETLEVVGGLAPQSRGYSPVELRWRSGWGRQAATAVEATPGRQATLARSGTPLDDWGARVPVVEPGLADRLAALDADVRVVEVDRPSSHGTLFGWQTPMESFWVLLVLWLTTFTVLAWHEHPQRATRAAWAWLVLLGAPLGPVAYLVLGGPAGLLRPPAPGSRRLTGGWALLLALLLPPTAR